MALLLAGRLRLLDPLGEGGTSTVRRAWDLRRRRFVAAKLVPRAAYAVQRTPRLDHPHVLTVDEVLTTPELVVHLMPLAGGGTTDRLLAEHGALPADYVAVLLDQLLDGLDAVHGSGCVHGDVKPVNLLLRTTRTARPHLRLADFGASVVVGDEPRAATERYLAPEARAGAAPEPGQDLFAVGATAVELLTGRLPRHPGDIGGGVPRGPLHSLLTDLVATDPARRPASAATARDRLRALGVPSGAPWQRRPHPPDVTDRLRRRRVHRP
jgi:serine/threonine-protein kinase